jgi:hypothetical protein
MTGRMAYCGEVEKKAGFCRKFKLRTDWEALGAAKPPRVSVML